MYHEYETAVKGNDSLSQLGIILPPGDIGQRLEIFPIVTPGGATVEKP